MSSRPRKYDKEKQNFSQLLYQSFPSSPSLLRQCIDPHASPPAPLTPSCKRLNPISCTIRSEVSALHSSLLNPIQYCVRCKGLPMNALAQGGSSIPMSCQAVGLILQPGHEEQKHGTDSKSDQYFRWLLYSQTLPGREESFRNRQHESCKG